MNHRMSFLWIVILVAAVALAACAQAPQPTPGPTKAAAPQTEPTKPTAAAAEPTKPAPAATKPAAIAPTAVPAAVKPLSPPVKVKYGSIGTLGGIATAIAFYKGYFADEGLDVEEVLFRTGGEMIPALAQGQLDVGSGAISAGLFNAIARDIALRLVAEPSGVDRTLVVVVRTDLANAIKDWKDLKGRKIALSSTGSSVEIKLEDALKKGGLTQDDVQMETMGFPDMLTAMANKSIDIALMTEPTVSQAVDKGVVVRWKYSEEISLDKQVGVLMYSAKFANENSEAAKRFMVGSLRGARFFYDFLQTGKNKEDIIAAAVKHTTVKDPKVYEDMVWPSIDPDQALKVKSIRDDLDWYVKKGYVKQAPPLEQVVDTSFVEYAVQRLGSVKR